jgi:hypothetical protein
LKKFKLVVLVVSIVLLSRFPFLDAGYGNDWDAWAIASTAKHLSLTGEYAASRLPGYPVPEFAYSLIWRAGPLALNGLTAVLSAIGIAFFSLSLRQLGYKSIILPSLALAFIPVVYINSTTSMDYVWALSFILASLYFMIIRYPFTSGVLLGVAIGCRITSAALVVPFALLLLLLNKEWPAALRDSVRFSMAAGLLGATAFIPVFLVYGWSFLSLAEGGYPPLLGIIRVVTVDVWGLVGLIALLIAAVGMARQVLAPRTAGFVDSREEALRCLAWVSALFLLGAIFLRLPHEAGYLIPALPFVLLLLGRFLQMTVFKIVCGVLILSPFIWGLSVWPEKS